MDFYFLAIVNIAAMNIGKQYLFKFLLSIILDLYSEVVILCLISFWVIATLDSTVCIILPGVCSFKSWGSVVVLCIPVDN